MMLPGSMRDRIEVLTRTATRGALGTSEEWAVSETLWGRMTPVSFSARAAYQQALNSEVTHRAVFRGRKTFSLSDNRLRWRNDDYEVVTPGNDVSGLGKETMVEVRKLDNGS